MKTLSFLLVILSLPFFLYSQNISGVVFDAYSQKPLHLANVYLTELKIGTTTDKQGAFSIDLSKLILPQEFSIRISFVGYKTFVKKIYSKDLPTKLEVHLEQQILPSQTVLVTSSVGLVSLLPITYSNLNRDEIKVKYTIQDFPQFLSEAPSVISYSENGNGIGYNYMSIRGFDQRRISVTINGIPQNDPEDHNVYWIDFPDLLEDVSNIQLQRGVSSNLVGAPAVGGSINIITSPFTQNREIKIKSGFGSYNTKKLMISFNSGLSDNYAFYGRLSKINSSGYRENSWVDFFSYFFSFVRFDGDITNQVNIFAAPISDGLAYTGLPKFAITNKNERKKNYSYWEQSGNSYSYKLPRRANEIENFNQPHIELLSDIKLRDNLVINSALFAYWGKGFFDYDASWGDSSYFRMTWENGFITNDNLSKSLVRAFVDNTQYGWIPRLHYNSKFDDFILGLELRRHRSLHWGSVWYTEGLLKGQDQTWRYYEYKGAKDILGGFIFYRTTIFPKFNLNVESQFVNIRTRLYDEKFVGTDFTINNFFVSPKVGFVYNFKDGLDIYGYIANVSREPRLKNYYDAAESSSGEIPQFEIDSNGNYDFSKPLVRPENLTNLELGWNIKKENWKANVNLFLMSFKDEIVKLGMVDRFGSPKTGNMDKTTHSGIEISSEIKPINKFLVAINLSYMRNVVNKGTVYVKYRDPITNKKKVAAIDLSGNRISNSPELIGNFRISYNHEKVFLSLLGTYVSKQFTDNFDTKLPELLQKYPKMTQYDDNIVPDYFVLNFDLRYNFEIGQLGKITIFGRVNNLLNRLYAPYGIGKEFFPAAERNFYGGIELTL